MNHRELRKQNKRLRHLQLLFDTDYYSIYLNNEKPKKHTCTKKIKRNNVNFGYNQNQRKQLIKAVVVCGLCGFDNKDALEVHHIDGNHNNNSWSNIAVVCSNCHTLLTKKVLNYWEELSRKNSKI